MINSVSFTCKFANFTLLNIICTTLLFRVRFSRKLNLIHQIINYHYMICWQLLELWQEKYLIYFRFLLRIILFCNNLITYHYLYKKILLMELKSIISHFNYWFVPVKQCFNLQFYLKYIIISEFNRSYEGI